LAALLLLASAALRLGGNGGNGETGNKTVAKLRTLQALPPALVGIVLVSANAPYQDLVKVQDGDVVNLDALGATALNLRADIDPARATEVGSVTFVYDSGQKSRTEKVAPFALGGDSGGVYNA